jgi:chorismate mutase/prephenate dehydratase
MAAKPRKKTSAARSPKATSSKAAPSKPSLDALRVKISALDEKIVELLNKRAAFVVQVGAIKREHGIPIYTPHREAEVLSRVLGHNAGPLHDRTIEGIYRELMSGSFRLEQAIRIGYLGPIGSYSHVAATRHFGTSVDFEDLHTIDGVFTEVARGHVDYGLVPIENSIGGGIAETLEAFQEHHKDIHIYAEVQLEVHHALLANCAPSEVKTIYSKPEVFAQCRTWLATQYPQAKLVPEASSSAGVRRVAQESERSGPSRGARAPGKRTVRATSSSAASGSAAIGSVLAAEIYDVNVLFENIEDRSGNLTRFFVISKHKAQPTGKDPAGKPGDKTSMMFTTPDKPGALVSVLAVFDRASVNLTHIDKRPSGKSNWEYTFFVDAEGHVDDPWVSAAITQARGHCRELTVLGSYPRSRRIL